MFVTRATLAALMLLLSTGEKDANPWKDKVADAVARARAHNTISAFDDALDVAWRADDWRAGVDIARDILRTRPDEPRLRGKLVRALWRAGRIQQAERLAALIPEDTRDHVAIRMRITIHLARGEWTDARFWADRLARGPECADDYHHIFAARFAVGDYRELPQFLRKAERLIDPQHGYPETHLAESIAGLPEFFDHVGTTPLNRVEQHGSVPMSALVMLNLPACDVLINGRGPYRMIIDTGGSIMLSLDAAVAKELGLESIADATVRGVSGVQATGQTIVDELQLGSIRCGRVLTRTFDVRGAIMNAADGIIGTGIFADARMTLDFANGRMVLSPSSPEPPAGNEADMRLVGDAKLMVISELADEPAVALLDSGADAVALAPSRLTALFPDQDHTPLDIAGALGVGSGEMPQISLGGSAVKFEMAGRTMERFGGVGLDILDNTLSPILGVQCDVLIGMPIFRELRTCTVDFPRGKLWLDWLER